MWVILGVIIHLYSLADLQGIHDFYSVYSFLFLFIMSAPYTLILRAAS